MSLPVDHAPVNYAQGGFGWRERAGSGPVLVALHGIGSDATAFDAVARSLENWRVIAWDIPGYGSSVPLPLDWPLARDYAQALLAFVTGLGLARFHLLGHSLGTLIGAAFARLYPERVESLVLASCAQGGGVVPGEALPQAHAERIDALQAQGPLAFARARAARLVYQPEANGALVAAVEQGMAKVRLPGYAQAVRMLAAGDLAADCAQLAIPTHVVVGVEDCVTLPEQSIRAHAAIPAAMRGALVQVAGAGHALHQQAPAALAAGIEAALHPLAPQQEKQP